MHKVYVNISYAYHRVVLRVVYLFDLNFYQNTTHIFPGITSRNNLISNFFNKYVHKTPSFSSKTSSRKGNKKKSRKWGGKIVIRNVKPSMDLTIFPHYVFIILFVPTEKQKMNIRAEPTMAGFRSVGKKERKKRERIGEG